MSVHLFKKGEKSNGKVKSSQEDLLDNGDWELQSKTTNGNRLGSYEQTDPVGLGVTANGPNRASMAAMREGGTILTVSFIFVCTFFLFYLFPFLCLFLSLSFWVWYFSCAFFTCKKKHCMMI